MVYFLYLIYLTDTCLMVKISKNNKKSHKEKSMTIGELFLQSSFSPSSSSSSSLNFLLFSLRLGLMFINIKKNKKIFYRVYFVYHYNLYPPNSHHSPPLLLFMLLNYTPVSPPPPLSSPFSSFSLSSSVHAPQFYSSFSSSSPLYSPFSSFSSSFSSLLILFNPILISSLLFVRLLFVLLLPYLSSSSSGCIIRI